MKKRDWPLNDWVDAKRSWALAFDEYERENSAQDQTRTDHDQSGASFNVQIEFSDDETAQNSAQYGRRHDHASY